MTELPVEISDAAAAVGNRRLALELDLIAGILAGPKQAIAICHAASFTPGHIEHDDLRLMYVTIEEFAHRGRSTIVRVIKRMLCLTGQWDACARRDDRTGRWSDLSLASLACSSPSNASVAHVAKEIMRIDGTVNRARTLYAEALRELREAV